MKPRASVKSRSARTKPFMDGNSPAAYQLLRGSALFGDVERRRFGLCLWWRHNWRGVGTGDEAHVA